ncbi:hypothetical protein HDV04_005927 [Boothiomyces sp. JEL0838]|nr:hypothetical protein HDV04_005927 [Boothiomyces sp. JEL0838]
MDVQHLETELALPVFDNTWNWDFHNSTNNAMLEDVSREMLNTSQNESLTAENTINSDRDCNASVSSWIESVSPSDEEAFQEQGGFSDDEWQESDDEDLSTDSMEASKKLTSHHNDRRFSNSKTTSRSCLFKSKRRTPLKSATLESLPQSSITLSSDLIFEIEVQKAKACKHYMDWKVKLPKLMGNQLNLLSEVFRLNLNTLKEGDYWFGTDFIINSAQPQAPEGGVFVGLIQSEGCSDKKYLVIIGRKKVELKSGYIDAITSLQTIKVDDEGVLAMYNKTKPAFQKVCANPPDLFFQYNPDLVFVGSITPDQKFKFKMFGRDEVHDLVIFPGGCQIFYTDHLSKLQNIYPLRVVVLDVVSDNVAIINFNHSHACYIRNKYQPKFIDFFIPAGANPDYF